MGDAKARLYASAWAYSEWTRGQAVAEIRYKEGRVLKKRPFTDDELSKVFQGLRYDKAWKKWIVLLAMFTGARVNEIAQLTPDDVSVEGGVPVIRITDEGEGQVVKTEASRRKVPVHAKLVELGFLDYCTSVKESVKQTV